MNIFERRKIRRRARELLHHARHMRNMREDLLHQEHLATLDCAMTKVRQQFEMNDCVALQDSMAHLIAQLNTIIPARPFPVLRENIEVLVVAVAVAMAFRSYFIQPFKIPTGSMQPTLYGIHYKENSAPSLFDRLPLNLAKWLVFGEWYCEFRAKAHGVLQGPYGYDSGNSSFRRYTIAGLPHSLPNDLALKVKPGETVYRGQILAAGVRITGDHIFVDKVRWQIRTPRRDEVMVFMTRDIPMIGDTKTHYIKRMVGMPDDTLSVDPPYLLTNGVPIKGYPGIERVQSKVSPLYAGYMPTFTRDNTDYCFSYAGQVRHLKQDEYMAMGDNTRSSFDSRYWGPVNRRNLIGPAFFVYWPISERWGLIR